MSGKDADNMQVYVLGSFEETLCRTSQIKLPMAEMEDAPMLN